MRGAMASSLTYNRCDGEMARLRGAFANWLLLCEQHRWPIFRRPRQKPVSRKALCGFNNIVPYETGVWTFPHRGKLRLGRCRQWLADWCGGLSRHCQSGNSGKLPKYPLHRRRSSRGYQDRQCSRGFSQSLWIYCPRFLHRAAYSWRGYLLASLGATWLVWQVCAQNCQEPDTSFETRREGGRQRILPSRARRNDSVSRKAGSVCLVPLAIVPRAYKICYSNLDLGMKELLNAKERTSENWKQLFHDADPRFKLSQIKKPPASELSIVEFTWEGEAPNTNGHSWVLGAPSLEILLGG